MIVKGSFEWFFLCTVALFWLEQQQCGVLALSGVVSVKPDNDECYRFRTLPSWRKDIKSNPRYLWGNFEAINDEMYGSSGPVVVFLATDNMAKTVYQSPEVQSSGHFDVKLEAGKLYWFCISNRDKRDGFLDDDFTAGGPGGLDMGRSIGFSFDLVTSDQFDYGDAGVEVDPNVDETTKAHREAKERASVWLKTSGSLLQRLKDMKSHFNYLRIREADHRSVTEQTFTDVLSWTVWEAVTVTVVAVGQILFFRRYLERKNRVLG